MWDARNFKGGMRDENKETGPGYAPFGRRDKGLDGYKRDKGLDGCRRDKGLDGYRWDKGLDGYRQDKGLDGYRRDHYLAPVKSHSMLNLSPLQIVERK